MLSLTCRKRPFVPVTILSRHGWHVVINLAGFAPYRPRPTLSCRDHRCPIGRGLRYLAVVIDAFSSRVLSWALGTHLDVSRALAARDMALAARRPAPDSLVNHADRGVQYACEDYTAKLAAQRIQ